MRIGAAVTLEELEQVRGLMRAYGTYLAEGPPGAAGPSEVAHICIPNYETEVAGLPGVYAGPEGVLLLAAEGTRPAGCVAMRPVRPKVEVQTGERACELKRLWVGEAFRGIGLGRRLMEAAIGWAREAGYGAVYLDTVPAAMPEAHALYQRLGFQQVERYNDNPVENVVFLRLPLG